jgi:signal transduction histidine kinase
MRDVLLTRITEIHPTGDRQADIWKAAQQAVVASTRERDRLLGLLSHELRQALGAALAAERLLVHGGPAAASVHAGDVLERQLLHLSRLVETILDFSRLSIGSIELNRSLVDVCDVAREIVEAVEPDAAAKGLGITMCLPDRPQLVMGDPTRLRQALSNLLHNAVRYTPAGGRIVCSVSRYEHNISIAVSDTGPGIDPADRERVFEPFARGLQNGAGLGVGLALARRIAELHGGRLTLESGAAAHGATFLLVLPPAPPRG